MPGMWKHLANITLLNYISGSIHHVTEAVMHNCFKAGQVGRSSFAAPRPAGGSEAPGPRGLGGGGRRRPTHPGPRGPEQRMGSGGGPAQRARPGLEYHCRG